MTVASSQPGKIITFYSYKGGTGRSMALANIACLLAKRLARTSQRVLVMDWDLEAPGLHRFFSAKSDLPEYESRPGVMNYFSDLYSLLGSSPDQYDQLKAPDAWKILDEKLPLDNYLIPDVVSGVDFMRAGRFDAGYAKLVGSFSWIDFFQRYSDVIPTFRELLAWKFGYTLVDSRTGLTDVSGICTTLLPEKLVGVFTPNRQSLYGLLDLITEAVEYRSKSDDFRPLSVFPLPSRVENAEQDLRKQWRNDYQEQFQTLFRKLHTTEQCDLTAYFDEVLLPHVSYYAYGENIAVLQERPDAISLSAAYQRFFDRLLDSDFAWAVPGEKEAKPVLVSSPVASQGATKYDAFLSYASADAKLVAQVESQLRGNGVKTFSLNDILPGENWSSATSKAMVESKAVVVFVGPSATGPFQEQEMLAALENFAKDPAKRIIPVLLPKAPPADSLRLPNFLRNVQWVDLRAGLTDEQAFGNLVWALTGEHPKQKERKVQRLYRGLVIAAILLLVGIGAYAGWRSLSYRGYVGDIAKYSKQVKQNPKDPYARYWLAEALASWGRTDEAIQQYTEYLRLKPDDFALGLSNIVDPLGRDRAISVYGKLIEQVPNSPALHYFLSEQLEYKGDLDDAISEARKAVELAKQDAFYHNRLAELLEKTGDLQGALDEYSIASKLKPDDQNYSAAVQRLSEALKNKAPTTGTTAQSSAGTVYIQIATEGQRKDAAQLQAALQSAGFTTPEIEVMGTRGTVNTYVRFFAPVDQAPTQVVLTIMKNMGFTVEPQDCLKQNHGQVPPRQLEVWIGSKQGPLPSTNSSR